MCRTVCVLLLVAVLVGPVMSTAACGLPEGCTQSPTSTPSEEGGNGDGDGDGERVYITATGDCYHRAGCQYLSSSSQAISLDEARELGKSPCSVCDPPQ